MNELTRKLEVSLGPETGDLCMRFGLHSGPVTAGVLRGEKSRFQLFGDTVNFASRMESTGQRNKIQASQATADLLIESGKRNWVHPRDELVNAKGKGQVKTFWIQPRSNSGSSRSIRTDKSDSMVNLKSKRKGVSLGRDPSNRSTLMNESATQSRRSLLSISQHSQIWSADDNIDIDYDGFDDGNRQERLIDWNVEILTGLLKRIVAHRRSKNVDDSDEDLILEPHTPGKSLEEITEIIPILSHKPDGVTALKIDSDTVELDTKVEDQLREYVTMVACMYRDNFFHNFEHASHVLMSAQKLLKRVIIADKERVAADEEIKNDYIRGIASDPLTQFAIVFSALLHDLDRKFYTSWMAICCVTKSYSNLFLLYIQIRACPTRSLSGKMLTSPPFIKTKVLPNRTRWTLLGICLWIGTTGLCNRQSFPINQSSTGSGSLWLMLCWQRTYLTLIK